jgi:von Willebrand factor type A domain/Sad1 / UNC-like C-terminal
MQTNLCRRIVALGCVLIAASLPAADKTNVEVILDASGSMKAKIGDKTKMEIAKKALYDLMLSIPLETNVAVRTYGHRRKDDCSDIQLLTNFSDQRLASFGEVIRVNPLGKTPLTGSIKEAAKDFAGKEGQDNSIILITDGEETCGGDPCAAAKAAHESGIKVKINVIGFKIEPKERAQLECIANTGGGKYVSANDAAELTAATQQVALEAPAVSTPAQPTPTPSPTPPSRFNLLAQSNGGQVLVAPNEGWLNTNDGKEDCVKVVKAPEEAVYAFKDEQPATFDTFSTLVPDASGDNAKELELLISDDSPTGTFRSIGTFTVQNAKMLKSPYQEFKFEPVTAKYLKIKIISNYHMSLDYWTRVCEFKVFSSVKK